MFEGLIEGGLRVILVKTRANEEVYLLFESNVAKFGCELSYKLPKSFRNSSLNSSGTALCKPSLIFQAKIKIAQNDRH